jgi:hypothetical protein
MNKEKHVIYDIVRKVPRGHIILGYLVRDEHSGEIYGMTHDEIIGEFYNGTSYGNIGQADNGGVYFPGSARFIFEGQARLFQVSEQLSNNMSIEVPVGVEMHAYVRVDGLRSAELEYLSQG